nr:response regulator transcription factor [Gemmatimonadota bacterium]NIR75683.1 response regulator transcription factor [Candidatus Kutchimonas denitrificans]NIS00296.1 response regulator transcription factor [Gemmatimonadota bacterium]NIT65955.1 response regulator transcription factor [Gemmatimonadota bacterium]NIU53659.1 response regulator [Gemmatimonadota bacterium]
MNDQKTPQILVVEDEADIAALVAFQLTHAGFRVRTASTGRQALRAIEAEPPDLVVLDLMLPEVGGLQVLRTIRSRKETRHTPVIVVTARGEEQDRLEGFEVGADDYVSKPFSPKELVLRVRAVLRRAAAPESGAARGRTLRAGPLTVDVDAHRVTVDDEEVELTPKEFRLLVCLLERRGRTQSRQDLLEAVWETTADIETRTVDMHVGRLRSKLGPAGDSIETVR